MTTYYHGSHNGNTAMHHGICLTDDYDVACVYAGKQGVVVEVEMSLSGLSVASMGAYDHDENDAPGDDGDDHGVDVLEYEDEDERGTTHDTVRLMTDAALAAVTSVEIVADDD